jgi:hypothetical protein
MRDSTAIGIGDAGPLGPKIKSNEQFVLNTKSVDNLTMGGGLFGAGFGYQPIKASLFECTFEDNRVVYYTVVNTCQAYQFLKRKSK